MITDRFFFWADPPWAGSVDLLPPSLEAVEGLDGVLFALSNTQSGEGTFLKPNFGGCESTGSDSYNYYPCYEWL